MSLKVKNKDNITACRKSLFFQKGACSQSLTPNPFPVGRGYFTGAAAPSPCRGLRPKARMLWLLAKSFARCKTNRASNTRHPILDVKEVCRQSVMLNGREFFTTVLVYYVLQSAPGSDCCFAIFSNSSLILGAFRVSFFTDNCSSALLLASRRLFSDDSRASFVF